MAGTENEFVSRVQGRKCARLLNQEHWYHGRLENEWNVLYLEFEDKGCVRFHFDAGVFFWREEKPSLPQNAEGNEYRLAEPPISEHLRGRQLIAASFGPLPSGGRGLGLHFEGPMSFYLHNVDDHSTVVLGN